jgi:predicted GIY-YIG superfamily endonuclease
MVSSVALAQEDLVATCFELRMAGHLQQICMMFYTYIIESLSCPGKRYIGHTSDLKQRVSEHNSGRCVHTDKFVPWKLKIYLAFETLEQAQHFERYLKSGLGHAFAGRHFWLLSPGE